MSEQKLSKAQRKRLQREENQRRLDQGVDNFEASSKYDARAKETDSLESLLANLNLRIHEVPADGDCMYSSIAHQLQLRGMDVDSSGVADPSVKSTKNTVSKLRRRASSHMLNHLESYLPFAVDPDSGDPMTPELFKNYCARVASDNERLWGGELELKAISQELGIPIKVVSADGSPIEFGTSNDQKPIVIW